MSRGSRATAVDAVEVGDPLVVDRDVPARGSRACRSTLSSCTSAIDASTSLRFALYPGTAMS